MPLALEIIIFHVRNLPFHLANPYYPPHFCCVKQIIKQQKFELMKTKLKLLMAVALLLVAYAARSQCNAAFTATDNGLGNIQLQSVNYVGNFDSANTIMFQWAFGDGTFDTTVLPRASHLYANSGTYNMCLTVIDLIHSCTVQQCDTHSVNLCTQSSAIALEPVGFGEYLFSPAANISGGSYTGTWSFSDGGTASGLTATHQFTSDGLYNVCFNVAGPGCLDTTCRLDTLVMCHPFNLDFTYHTVSTNPYTAEFVVTNPNPSYHYDWISSDGSYGPTADSTQFTFNHNGPDTVTLLVASGAFTCVDSVKHIINVDRCDLLLHVNENSNGTTANFNVSLIDSSHAPVTYLWSFPGGSPPSSINVSPSVTFTSLGTYIATLYASTQSGCTDTLYNTFTLTPPPPPAYNIQGQVTAGTSSEQAVVYLIVQDNTGHLTLFDSTVIHLYDSIGTGYYTFYNLPVNTYYVKAALAIGSQHYANYLPTYYNNALNWVDATAVDLTSGDANGIDITLVEGVNPGGPGFVGGYVDQGAGMALHQGGNIFRSLGDPLAGVQINLVTSADEAVAYTYTDAAGYYQFSNLAYGSYKIYADQLNKTPVPIPFTLSPSDSAIADLNISINSDSATATGISDIGVIAIQGVYPNPVINILEVLINSKQENNATIKLVDILGRTIITRNTKLASGNNKLEVDMEKIPAGIYQLIIQTNSQQRSFKVLRAK